MKARRALVAMVFSICTMSAACTADDGTREPSGSDRASSVAALASAGASYTEDLKTAKGVVLSLTEAEIRVDSTNHNMQVTGLDGTTFRLIGATTYLDASQSSDPDAFVKADFDDFQELGVSAERAEYEMALLKLLVSLPEQISGWGEHVRKVARTGSTYVVVVDRAAVSGINKTDIIGDPAFTFTISAGNIVSWGISGAKQQHITVEQFAPVNVSEPTHIVPAPGA